MIPVANITAWGNVVPWAEPRQVEQDLIICRALIEIFSDDFLKNELRFRGGTALNKLHFPKPIRYSEDIDLVRTTAGPIGPVLDRVRFLLEPWLGRARFEQSKIAPKLSFRAKAEDAAAAVQIRLKIEIHTAEREAYDTPQSILLQVENPWFSGKADIATFSREEMLATKLRALLQRDKGRDLFDLAHAFDVFDALDTARVAEYMRRYLERSKARISRAEAEERMFAKLLDPGFLADIRPLLAAEESKRLTDDMIHRSFAKVFSRYIAMIEGEPWARSEEMKEHFGIAKLF
jgi:predicted nucleotidyltransferase component of viral defense system